MCYINSFVEIVQCFARTAALVQDTLSIIASRGLELTALLITPSWEEQKTQVHTCILYELIIITAYFFCGRTVSKFGVKCSKSS